MTEEKELSTAWVPSGKEKWGGEKQALSGVILTAGAAKYQSIPAGHNKGEPLQDHTLAILIQRKKKKKKILN